jgi:hypothetical protein
VSTAKKNESEGPKISFSNNRKSDPVVEEEIFVE